MRGRKLAGRKLRFELEFISGVSLKELKYKAKTRKPWKWPRPPTVKLIIILTMEGFFFLPMKYTKFSSKVPVRKKVGFR